MRYHLLKSLLFRFDPERSHEIVGGMLRAAANSPLVLPILRAAYAYDDPILAVECIGLRFANPVGLAAGFDKRADLIGPMAALGFGHIEVGTVTPRPQPGNDRPRLFRLPEDCALINRLGFNSPGMVAVGRNLRNHQKNQVRAPEGSTENQLRGSGSRFSVLGSPIIGVNIGKNRATELERAAEDYLAAFMALAPLADYIAINISSPNTPGLRRLHERAALAALLGELTSLNRRMPQPRPLLLKVSPDEPAAQLEEVVRAGCEAGIAGFIATNTTLARTGLRSPLAGETGGLSGQPLAGSARRIAGQIYALTRGQLPVIGVGGIASAEDAYARIRAGASLVQLYTGMIYEGPGLIYAIKRGLSRLLRRDGFTSVAEAVGTGVEIGD